MRYCPDILILLGNLLFAVTQTVRLCTGAIEEYVLLIGCITLFNYFCVALMAWSIWSKRRKGEA